MQSAPAQSHRAMRRLEYSMLYIATHTGRHRGQHTMSACFHTVGRLHSMLGGQPASAAAVTDALVGIKPTARAAAWDRHRSKRHGRTATSDAVEPRLAWRGSGRGHQAGRAGPSAMTLTCLLVPDEQQQQCPDTASCGMNIRVRGPTGQTTLTGEAQQDWSVARRQPVCSRRLHAELDGPAVLRS